ncbi:MAG TPA: hypothetical protein DCP08_09085 [Chloroflexi bacterium]|nr:hypothetical protein [Chloroflexota bacterium]
MHQLDSQFGVSTLWMPPSHGETIFEAIEMAKRAGFKAFEIVPQVVPRFGRPSQLMSMGFYPDDMDNSFFDRLAEEVADFSMVTVHSPHVDLNIASTNRGIREESIRQFLQLIEIGHKISANPVTFHHGQGLPGVYIDESEFGRILKHNVDFGIEALELGEEYDIQLGYENLGGPTAPVEKELLQAILERIGTPRFGINLDIGHLSMVDGEPKDWIVQFGSLIKEVHIHGTYWRRDRDPALITHSPLEMEDNFDFAEIMNELRGVKFSGPIIFEIHAKDIPTYLDFATRGKEMLKSSCGDGLL